MTADDSTLPTPVIADEHIQLVDARNRPCGSAPRALMRRFHFWHRATYIVVRNAQGDICVQRRTLIKEVFPGGDDLAAGGVVGAGEAVHLAARRELAEETGITDAVIDRVAGVFHSRREYKDDHIVIFAMRADAEAASALHAADIREIAEARWFDSDVLPPDCSPATARRIAEFRDSRFATGIW